MNARRRVQSVLLLLVVLLAVGVLLSRDEDGDQSGLAQTMPGGADVPSGEGEAPPEDLTATAGASPRLAAVGNAPKPRRAAAHEGVIVFHYEQGYSFLTQTVAEEKGQGADLIFETCAGGISSVTLSAPGGGITNLSALRGKLPKLGAPEALRRALVRADPETVSLSTRSSGDSRSPHTDVFLVHTRRGEWVKLALVERGTQGGWTKLPVTLRYKLMPDAPIFEDTEGDLTHAGFVVDTAGLAARSAEVREERQVQAEADERERRVLERPIRERLADLDRRAAALEATVRAREGGEAHVAAVVQRRYAKPLGRGAYVAATYSFEKVTRDDDVATRNDWDFLLTQYGGQLWLDVTTVTDDRSLIRDLGSIDFEAARRGELPPGEGSEQVAAVEGHLYLIHTLDSESDHWVLLRILEIESEEAMLFRWEMLADPGPLRAALIPETRTLQAPEARLQIRGGAGGGNPNRAFLDGSTNARVDELVDHPLDFTKPLSSRERCRAYIEGGYVPSDHVFLIQSIEYTARADGDSNGHGEFLLRVGSFRIAHLERDRRSRDAEEPFILRTIDRGSERISPSDFPVRRSLAVNIAIPPNTEKHVFVEIANSSFADVVLRGVFVPVAELAKRGVKLHTGVSYRTAQWLLQKLAETGAGSATHLFDGQGPEIVPWLEAVRSFAVPGAYRRRLDATLVRLRQD